MKKSLVAAGILIGGAFVPVGAVPSALPRETWLGVYVNGTKIGYIHTTTDRATYKDRPGYKMDSFWRSRVVLLGTPLEQDVHTVIYADEKFIPVYEEFEMTSGGHATRILASFTDKTVECEVISEGTSKKSIPIPEGANLVGDQIYALEGRQVRIGDSFKLHCFNALTLTIDEIISEVLREEELKLNGETLKSIVIKYRTPLGEMTCWQTRDGDLLKITALAGMTMIRETKEKALALDSAPAQGYRPPSDFAVLTSVKANRDIQNPSRVRKMRVRLIGLDDKGLLISDERQQAKLLDGGGQPAAEFIITSKPFDAKRSSQLGVNPEEVQQYLAESPYIQVKDKAIWEKAAEIADSTTSAYEAARKIRAWVHKTMTPKADIGVPRSALDVLKKPVGVCRDYATLFTALCRAAGIPTRMIAGLTYLNGSFYYHAWAESFVGEWVPFDATLPTDVVDATHVKLTEGDATSIFTISKAVGSLKAEILEIE